MKGLTLDQFKEIVDFVQKHHKFGWVEEKDRVTEYSYSIKYIDSVYDSRGGDIWLVKFRGFGKVCFSTSHFNAINPYPQDWKYDNLYDWIMDFLNGKWEPTKEFTEE